MRKKILTIALLTAGVMITNPADAQIKGLLNNLEKKIGKKKEEKEKEDSSSESKDFGKFVNIAEYADKWESGEYEQFEIDGYLTLSTGNVKVEFIKGDDGSVKEIKVGDESYKRDTKSNSPIVVSYYKKGGRKLYFNETGIIQYYYWKGTGGYEEFSVQRFIGAKQKAKEAAKEIRNYRVMANEKAEKDAETYAQNAKAEAEKKEAQRKEKYGLSNKEVSKIEFINVKIPEIFGHWSGGGLRGQVEGRNISFDLKATLKDGTVITTTEKNTGYLSDYTISYDEKSFKYGQLETGWSDDDVLTITAKCKSNPSLVVKKEIPIKYNQSIGYNRNAVGYSGQHGYSAQSFKVEVKQVNHKKTGAPLLKYRITNISTGQLVDEAKISPDYTLTLSCRGGTGGVASNGVPKNGGNGGHILLIKDPSVKKMNFDYNIDGGQGGTGRYNSGQTGRRGTFKERVEPVKF